MYSEGNIIYFDPFFFKNGNQAKRKYFLVLKSFGPTAILASLPSSVAHLPSIFMPSHGCIDLPESGISCYIFEKGRPITESGWSFSLNPFLYGNWIDDYDWCVLKSTYQVAHMDYVIIGKLTEAELENVKSCFRNSPIVKRKYPRLLKPIACNQTWLSKKPESIPNCW